jgi:protein TonB
MNYQARGFQISFLIHGLIICLVIFSSSFMERYKKVITINFDLYSSSSEGEYNQQETLDAYLASQSVDAAENKMPKDKNLPVLPEEKLQATAISEIPPAVELPKADKADKHTIKVGAPDESLVMNEESSQVKVEENRGSAINSNSGNQAGGGGAASTKYLKNNYAYIRDRILRNVSYPNKARRMGWQGKVALSFIITASGYVRDFKVIQSSGFKILDNDAIETVKKTAPFPKPINEANIAISIVYRLE